MRAAIILLALFGCVGSILAASGDTSLLPHRTYGPWHSGEIGGGGFLQQVFWAQSDPQRLYLASDVGGLWRSDDGGQRWTMLHGALPARADSYSVRGLAVDPGNADRFLAALDSGVWLSEDAGANFRLVQKTKFLGNGPNRAEGVVVLFDPQNPENVYAAGMGDGFFLSRDRGLSWTRSGPEGINPVDIYIDQQNAKRIWMCALPVDRDWNIPAPLTGGIYLSDDAGASWTHISDERVGEIRQLPFEPHTLIGLERAKQVVLSRDAGRTWEVFNAGLAPREKGDARADGIYTAIDTGPDFVILGAHGGNFYRLEKGDREWRRVFERDKDKVEEGDWWGSLKVTYPHFGSALGWVKVNPHNPDNWAFTDWYAVYLSQDAGQSWRLSIDGIEMTVVHCLAQDLTDRMAAHLGVADVGYFHTTNGGGKFTQRNTGISNNVKHIAVCPARPGRLYGTGPKTWNWYANQTFRSDDNGLSWVRPAQQGLPKMEQERCNTIVVHPRKPDEVYLAVSGQVEKGRGGVYKSSDGGENWTWFSEGFTPDEEFFRSQIWVSGPELAVCADGALIAASVDHGRIMRLTPGGNKWEPVDLKGGQNSVIADSNLPDRFWLARKEGGLWRSDNGGADWSRFSDRDAWHVALDHNNPGFVAFGGRDGVYFSADSGKNWRRLPEGLPYRHERNVFAFTHERLLVGSGGNGVFWINLKDITAPAVSHGGQ